jgi:N-formylglutamate amidohydrolase
LNTSRLDQETGEQAASSAAPFEIDRPSSQSIPYVFASPHSGRNYPQEFVAESRLNALEIRKSEDAFVDELFAEAPVYGAPLLKALYPRAYVDPNREAWELDPRMFEDKLPGYVNTSSARVYAGLGTVARVVCSGAEIYDRKIKFAEAKRRIEEAYLPYHRALAGLIQETLDRFGRAILIDCHSMPSVGGPMDRDHGAQRVDFVLGNNHGETCAPALMKLADTTLEAAGYVVRRNNPYSGGFTTRHYGKPSGNVQALQIEINRHLYMDEARIERGPGFAGLKADIGGLLEALAAAELAQLAAE